MTDRHRHREDVIRRLLDQGLSTAVLGALLPGWVPLIRQVAGVPERHLGRDERCDPEVA